MDTAWWRPKHVPERRPFKYKWKHLPSNRTGVREREFYTEAEFQRALERWNKISPDWKYWPVDNPN